MAHTPSERRISSLRHYRVREEPDRTLGFLRDQFKREVEKPHKQLGKLAGLWAELVPAELSAHTRLESFSRGTLRVAVDSSSHLFELDRLLRSGLQQQLISRHTTGSLRRVQLRVAS